MAAADNVSAFPTLSVITLPPHPPPHSCRRKRLSVSNAFRWAFLGCMLGHLDSVLAYLGACSAMQQLDSLEFSPKSSFYCNLLHISNTQITLLPPHLGRSWVLCWAILALSWGHLGTMLGFVGSSWAYVGPAWDYVGRSWVLCWAILALCWPILGHVARCSNLTPCNSPQRAVFTVIYSAFCTFPTSKSPDNPPPPPMAPYVGRSWVLCLCWPSLGLCWAFLGSMLGHLGSVLAYLGACCAMQQLDSL